MDHIILKQLSSLEKVFVDSKPKAKKFDKISVLKGERFSYQFAFSKTEGLPLHDLTCRCGFKVLVRSPLKNNIKIRLVKNVASEMPAFLDANSHDDDFISTKPGLYPDLLAELESNRLYAFNKLWHSAFVTVDIDKDLPAGEYPIDIVCKICDSQWRDDIPVSFENGKLETVLHMTVKVIDAVLPESTLTFGQWFHTDCIATYYGTKCFSEKHWKLIEKFMKTATSNGMNNILVPMFTPPLDTFVGAERPTVQLVDVFCDKGKYTFNFDKFDRFIRLAQKCGYKYFELSHLFTQWGAEKTPKIIATVDGVKKRIFGWDVASDSKEYFDFLAQYLPELVKRLKALDIDKTTYFHISDEPGEKHLEHYKKLKKYVEKFTKGFKIADALSNYEFYSSGAVDMPIVSTNHADPFIENNVKDLFVYYCCGQFKKVSNRFFAMPSYRNRIIGSQFFKYNIAGFLTWGYNFYYSKGSEFLLDPFSCSDALGAFPSGDSFSVYPGRNGPLESLRLVVFTEALADLRAENLLASYIGHDAVVKIIEEEAGSEITFFDYPRSADFILKLRKRINDEIEKVIAK